MENKAVNTDSSISSDLLNSAKKRLGSNFWLSLLGVFIYHNYKYFLHIFYSKKEHYCYDYMKHLTDYYIIEGITWEVFGGYVLRALAIALTIYLLSLGFNFLKKLINGYVDTKNDYLTKRKEESYKVQLTTDRKEFELKREKGKLESMMVQNHADQTENSTEKSRLTKLSKNLESKETTLNSKSKELEKNSAFFDKVMDQQQNEKKQIDIQKLALNERTIELNAKESDLEAKLQTIKKEKDNIDKYIIPKLLIHCKDSSSIKDFIINSKSQILNGEIINYQDIPVKLDKFLLSNKLISDTGDDYYVFNNIGVTVFKKLYEKIS